MALPGNFRNVVVVGASAGGVEAMIGLFRSVPADYPGAIFVVQHMPAYAKSNLDVVLQSYTKLNVKKGDDGEAIEGGTVYVARSDQHLMMERDRVVISKGPKENRFRPAVDTLFRSAAHAFRNRVVGVVLSGALNDGTSGMWTINRLGGTTIVQDPEEAMFADMPSNVMEYTSVNYMLPVAQIGPLLYTLAQQEIEPKVKTDRYNINEPLLEVELGIAKGKNGLEMGITEMGTPSPLACPECHGALTQFKEGNLLRFRCHTGHAHTAESLLASIHENVEKSMWEVMRGMEESKLLLGRVAEQLQHSDRLSLADQYRQEAERIQRQAISVQEAILGNVLSDTGVELVK
jgi:two-component system chemotaxis response regulator CheB